MPHISEAKQEIIGWALLVAALCACLGIGGVFTARYLPAALGIQMDAPVGSVSALLGFLFCALVVIVFLVYFAAVIWMLAGRLFLPRAVMYRIMTAGPTTRFDRWLFDKLYPQAPYQR